MAQIRPRNVAPESELEFSTAFECFERGLGANGAGHADAETWSYRVILTWVKTAISVPDDTFDRVTRRAAVLGMSRSEFFARAAQRYLDEQEAESLTEQIDSALECLGGGDETQEAAVEIGRQVLGAMDDEW